MRNNLKPIAFALALVMSFVLVSAGDFIIEDSSGNPVFVVDTSGYLNISGYLRQNGVLLNDTYLPLTGGTITGQLTLSTGNVTLTMGSFVGDGSLLTDLDASNITTGTLDFARLPNLENMTTLSYHNLTDIPTCSVGQHLFFDGTDMSCTADGSGIADYTNIALTNQTNTFTPNQVFSGGVNVSKSIVLADDNANITRAGQDTTMWIDSSGNVHFKLA